MEPSSIEKILEIDSHIGEHSIPTHWSHSQALVHGQGKKNGLGMRLHNHMYMLSGVSE